MTGSTSGYDADGRRERTAAGDQRTTRSIALEFIIVRYENRPDRCTIAPRDCPDAERMTTWLSADVDAFVDLENHR